MYHTGVLLSISVHLNSVLQIFIVHKWLCMPLGVCQPLHVA